MLDDQPFMTALQNLLPLDQAKSPIKLSDTGSVKQLELPDGGLPLSDLGRFFELCLKRKELSGFLPDEFQHFQHVYLTRLAFQTGQDAPVGQFVLGLQWKDASWSLLPGILDVKELNLTLAEFGAGASRRFQGAVSGTAALRDVDLYVSVALPSLGISASLASDSQIQIKSLLEHFQLDTGGLDGLTIDTLSVRGDVYARICSFSIGLSDHPPLQIGHLQVQSLTLDVTYIGGPQSEVSGAIGGQVELDLDPRIKIDLSAEHAGHDAGWGFSGQAEMEGQGLKVSHIVKYLESSFGVAPTAPLPGDPALKSLGLSFNTRSHDFTFTCEVDLKLDGQTAPLFLDIELTRNPDGGYDKHLGGRLNVGELEFDLIFDQQDKSSTFLALYKNPGGGEMSLKSLVAAVSTDAAILGDADPSFKLKDVLFAYQAEGKFLFALDMDVGLDLSGLGHLPLVGSALPADQALRLAFEPILTSSDAEKRPDLKQLQPLLPEGAPHLPDKLEGPFSLVTNLRLGDLSKVIDFGAGDDDPLNPDAAGKLDAGLGTSQPPPADGTPPDPAAAAAAQPGKITWVELQKNFGPLHFERLGLGYQQGTIDALLDAALVVGPLTIALQGLGAEYNLASKALAFSLQGLGIDFRQDPLEIGGTFMRLGEDFAGKVVIRGEGFGLDALGLYGEHQGQPSLFIYAFLDYPLGGPSFFFVEGLAAGFGLNRRLIVPPIEQVHTFPLVAEVIGTAQPPSDLTGPNPKPQTGIRQEMTALSQYIPPELGQFFLAVGLKFNSFRLVDCFALLNLSFGQHFEVDVLGVATLKVPSEPSDAEPLAEVQMAFAAKFSPEEGYLLAQAQLTPQSYVLSRQCRLQGGFAFASWFLGPHSGDFVYTLGGYHPHFHVPAHYPNVPRLGFNWQLDPHTTIKGALYYALTPAAVMAGGSLQATWESGDVKAWFTLGADFLMAWKPYHYEASAYVEIGAQLTIHFFGTHHVSINAGADLEIWGPEFSGIAHVHVKVLGIKVNFTVSFQRGGSARPPKLDWATFQGSFLPEPAKTCSVAIQGGLIRKVPANSGGERWIVNAKELCLVTDSAIPLTDGGRPFGIEPMGVTKEQFESSLEVKVTRDKSGDATADFERVPVRKAVPAALWSPGASPTSRPNLSGESTITALTGYALHPRHPAKPGASSFIERGRLSYEVNPCPVDADPTPRPAYTPAEGSLADALQDGKVVSERATLLESLGFTPAASVCLSDGLAEAFVTPPQVASLDLQT